MNHTAPFPVQTAISSPETELLNARKRLLTVCVLLFSAFAGARAALGVAGIKPNILLDIVIGSVLALYCWVEGQRRGKPIPVLSLWLLGMTWPVSVPGYLLWLGGRRELLRTIGRILLVLIVYILAFTVMCGLLPERHP